MSLHQQPNSEEDGSSTAARRAAASWGMASPPDSDPARRAAEDAALSQAESELLAALEAAWSLGWMPGEVIRQITRTRSPGAADVIALAVAADHARRPAATLHPRWASHVRALGLPPVPGPSGWLRSAGAAVGLPPARCLTLARGLVQAVAWLRGLGVVVPPPGSAAASTVGTRTRPAGGRPSAPGTGPDLEPVLDKVRALLAQAESTTFEAEAETFTAKAQELMARYSLDAALVWGAGPRQDDPSMVRIPVEDPYLSAKTALLHVVARSCRCSSVYYKGYALAVVVGYDADLIATETLYTSLLVQAQIFLQQEAAGSRPGDHVRSRGFRSSFLYSFAQRIGHRLSEVTRQVEEEAMAGAGGSNLLPVLADRGSRIEAKTKAELGPVRTRRASSSLDAAGWQAGARAADRARLDRNGALGPQAGLPPG